MTTRPAIGTPSERIGYTTPEVVGLTGVTYRRLDYWDRRGLFSPSIAAAEGSGTKRLYSSDDVAALQLAVELVADGHTMPWALAKVRELAG